MDEAWWLLFFVFVIPGILIWMFAVHHLMTRGDDEFPGRYDKPLWAVLLTFTGVFGGLVYLFLRNPLHQTDEP